MPPLGSSRKRMSRRSISRVTASSVSVRKWYRVLCLAGRPAGRTHQRVIGVRTGCRDQLDTVSSNIDGACCCPVNNLMMFGDHFCLLVSSRRMQMISACNVVIHLAAAFSGVVSMDEVIMEWRRIEGSVEGTLRRPFLPLAYFSSS